MQKTNDKNSLFEICPVRNIISRFGNRWSFLVLLTIHEQEVVRYNELSRLIPDISSRVLSSTLKTLEVDGLLHRKLYPTVPPKVEYSLTDMGSSLIPLISQLTEWANKHMDAIKRHRAEAEQRMPDMD